MLVLIKNGIHNEGGNIVNINLSISIVGESREHCIVIGGLMIGGKEEDNIDVQNLTLRESKGCGIFGFNSASIHLNNVSVVKSNKGSGVSVYGTKRNTMKNCEVSYSEGNGLYVGRDGLMTIEGNATSIHHNCTSGKSGSYGLFAYYYSSSIHLVSPLTKEMISTKNGGDGNYGGHGTIKTVKNNTKEENRFKTESTSKSNKKYKD